MLYLSGIHALNIECQLDTCGDWHQSGIKWNNLKLLDSKESIFADYGIEMNKKIPGHDKLFNVANHIRALLDLLLQGNFSLAQGMRDDFICNDDYTNEIFNKVVLLKNEAHWNEIDKFMSKEYMSEWIDFKRNNYQNPLEIEDLKEVTILAEDKEKIEGELKVYNVNSLAIMKANAYISRDRLRDLYDITFICNNYWEQLSDTVKLLLRETIRHKGIEQFDYLIHNQADELIDSDKLAENFLEMYDRLGLLADDKEIFKIKNNRVKKRCKRDDLIL